MQFMSNIFTAFVELLPKPTVIHYLATISIPWKEVRSKNLLAF